MPNIEDADRCQRTLSIGLDQGFPALSSRGPEARQRYPESAGRDSDGNCNHLQRQISVAYFRNQSDECREAGQPAERRQHEMTIFTTDHDNNITAFASATEAKSNPETERFRSANDLAKLAAKWPASRLIEIWNSLPGVSPVRKFTSRQTAVSRIWKAIQSLAPNNG